MWEGFSNVITRIWAESRAIPLRCVSTAWWGKGNEDAEEHRRIGALYSSAGENEQSVLITLLASHSGGPTVAQLAKRQGTHMVTQMF